MNVIFRIAQKLGSAADIVRAVLGGIERIDNIEIYGRQEFRRSVTAALVLLRDKKMPAWDRLSQHVSSIFEAREATLRHPLIQMSPKISRVAAC